MYLKTVLDDDVYADCEEQDLMIQVVDKFLLYDPNMPNIRISDGNLQSNRKPIAKHVPRRQSYPSTRTTADRFLICDPKMAKNGICDENPPKPARHYIRRRRRQRKRAYPSTTPKDEDFLIKPAISMDNPPQVNGQCLYSRKYQNQAVCIYGEFLQTNKKKTLSKFRAADKKFFYVMHDKNVRYHSKYYSVKGLHYENAFIKENSHVSISINKF